MIQLESENKMSFTSLGINEKLHKQQCVAKKQNINN